VLSLADVYGASSTVAFTLDRVQQSLSQARGAAARARERVSAAESQQRPAARRRGSAGRAAAADALDAPAAARPGAAGLAAGRLRPGGLAGARRAVLF